MSPPIAIVVGAGGGIGQALCNELEKAGSFGQVIRYGRSELDLCSEDSIAQAAAGVPNGHLGLFINAAGLLQDAIQSPEKSLRSLDPVSLRRSFDVNAVGPALLMKHFLPKLPRQGRAIFACLSARVGSIGDNRAGGWYGYRASKAALNQLLHTASIELARTHPEAICAVLHPGTVATKLSVPFLRQGQASFSPSEAAGHLLSVIGGLQPGDSGKFFDWRGEPVPW